MSDIETIEYNGRKISFGPGGGKEHLLGGEGPIITRNFDIKPGEVFFDVGAADSSWTLYALASGAKMVYAFEPLLNFHKKINVDLIANEGFYERCRTLLVGLDTVDNVKTIAQSYTQAGGSEGLGIDMPEMQVPTRFLPMDFYKPEIDDPSIGRLDWIKMDIEGYEWEAIKSGRQLIEKYRPNLIIENHQYVSERIGKWMRKDRVIEQIWDFFFKMGYRVYEDTHPHCYLRSFIVARRRE